MRATTIVVTLTAAAIAGAGLWWVDRAGWLDGLPFFGSGEKPAGATASANRRILYYRNPMGNPDTSPVPKKDSMGMDYIPVYADEPPAAPAKTEAAAADTSGRRILYYRNPMGLADTSPVPKKDTMGMDYIPVYAEAVGEHGTVRLSLDKVQRLGVRTEAAKRQVLNETVILTGTVAADERNLSVVSLKFRANIVKLHVASTGETVHVGQPLFDVHSPFILQQEAELAIALRSEASSKELGGVYARANDTSAATARERLDLYEVPDYEINRLIFTRKPSGHITWLARHPGTVIEKPIVAGMHADEGLVLYRIADLSHVWIIAEAPEAALAIAKPGATARITLNAYPGKTLEGAVTFVYPEVAMTTRTVKVRIELENKDHLLIPGMFASVEVASPSTDAVLTVPDSAVIDSGSRQIVLVARGEGLFQPRGVTVGRRSGGRAEIAGGLKEGETVVTSATFLIDAESNLRAALQGFTAGGGAKP